MAICCHLRIPSAVSRRDSLRRLATEPTNGNPWKPIFVSSIRAKQRNPVLGCRTASPIQSGLFSRDQVEKRRSR